MTTDECFDVTIIGGGPAGLYSAFYSGLREMKTKIIEFQPHLGGKIHVYPEKLIWDVGGMTPTTGAKLIDQLVEQGLTFNPDVVLNEKIVSITKQEDGIFVLKADSGRVHYSKTIIIATGSGILQPHKLELDGAEKYEVSNLHYTVKTLSYFKNKTVVISGGGDSAIDWANELEPIAKKVYLTHRKAKLKGHESNITKMLNSSVECILETSITKLIASPNRESIESVELTNHETKEVSILPVDDVIVNHGFDRDASLLENSDLNIPLVDGFFIKGNPTSESCVPGVYAAGDILTHEGKLNLIAGAFQDAANAVNKAKKYVEPDAQAVGMVSSHNVRFKKRNKEIVQKMVKE